MPKMLLTELSIKNLKAEARTDWWDTKLPSFGLRVGPRNKTFIVKVGNSRRTIGSYPSISLQDARRAAQIQKIALPPAPSSISPTFQEAYRLFLAIHVDAKKRTTQENYKGHFDRHFLKPFGDKRLDDISYRDITSITDKLTPSNRAYALAVIRIFWNFCRRRQLTTNNPTNSVQVRPSPARDRVLSDTEFKCVWLATEEATTFNIIVRLLMLTGQRRGEIAALQTSWIQDDEITLPKEITKNGNEHSFPITKSATSILARHTTKSGPLFSAKGKPNDFFSGWSKSKLALDKKLGDDFVPWTLHDLRRTYATNLAKLGTPIHITEKLLNHISGTFAGITGVYQRHSYKDEMKSAVELWERRLAEIIAA